MRSSRVRMAMIWRAYSLGHVTAVCRYVRQSQAQLIGQPSNAGLFHSGRLAVLHTELVVKPVAFPNPKVFSVAGRVGGQVALIEQGLVTHHGDQLRSADAKPSCGLGKSSFHAPPYAACAAGLATLIRWLMDSMICL